MNEFQRKLLQHELTQSDLESIEEHAWYESGLVADGCFGGLDDYAKGSITRYGRLLLKSYREWLFEDNITHTSTPYEF